MTSPNVVLELRPPRLSTALYAASLVVGVALVVFAVSTGGPPLLMVVLVAAAAGLTGYNTEDKAPDAQTMVDFRL